MANRRDRPPPGFYELYKPADINFKDWLKDTYALTGEKWTSSLSLNDQVTEIILNPAIPIPRSAVKDGRDALRGREASAAWYAERRTARSQAADDNHAEEIAKLQPAVDLLEQTFNARPLPEEPPVCQSSRLRIFDGDYFKSVDINMPARGPDAKLVAVWARKTESKDVRDFFTDSMQQYQQGKLTLPVLVQTFDAAVHMLQLIDCKWQESGAPEVYEDMMVFLESLTKPIRS